tara:strand:+ start:574 stop:1293 length:720 start_codon:yes stop_codon:yes gene_type:complete
MKLKRAACIQPNFFPWIGYYEIIKFVDIFLVLDDVQYTKRDWRNRNYINFNGTKIMITIPVESKGKVSQKINQTKIYGKEWFDNFFKKIQHSYQKTSHYELILPLLKSVMKKEEVYLSKLTIASLLETMKFLELKNDIFLTSDYKINPSIEKNQRIIKLCKKFEITNYLTGPNALNYLEPVMFKDNNISLEIVEYPKQINYMENNKYLFLNNLSIIDLLFHRGKESKKYLQEIKYKTII